ncbi:MAG: RagB/SusD family nutrient uptake outer membrane protein [Tannerella sp.]|jgi:hypothetical protein|nr:RagB/SusD family nutrient uptake outer membrane protein [Tannerella sp.]
MKKIIISILSFGLLFTACSGFLETEPSDKYTQDNYWQTQERATAALNGIYASLLHSALYGGDNPLILENLTPNAYHYQGDDNNIVAGRHNASTGLFNTGWNRAYEGIGRANNFLGSIDRVPMDEVVKKRYIAEAKFLRAVFYFPLWNLYGGAPLILEPTNDATQQNLPRNSADELLTQILKDLNEAAETGILPKSYSGADKGRVTIGAVLAFKARILLYAGRFAEAATAAKQVIDLGVYDLFPGYRELFYLENEGNQEVVFDLQYKYPEFCHSFDMTLDEYNNVAPLPDLVNDYYATDGLPISESPAYDPANPYNNRDPRLQSTVIVKGSQFKGAVVKEGQYPRTGYGQKKYTVYKDDEPKATIRAGDSELNYMFLRYADVLLMYAEAKNETSGPDAEIYLYLNKIRVRAGMPHFPDNLSQDELRKEIRHERRIELAGEGFYFYDIRRWRISHLVMNGEIHNDKGERIEVIKFENHRVYLWPVPSIAIQENPKLQPQNEGFGI